MTMAWTYGSSAKSAGTGRRSDPTTESSSLCAFDCASGDETSMSIKLLKNRAVVSVPPSMNAPIVPLFVIHQMWLSGDMQHHCLAHRIRALSVPSFPSPMILSNKDPFRMSCSIRRSHILTKLSYNSIWPARTSLQRPFQRAHLSGTYLRIGSRSTGG